MQCKRISALPAAILLSVLFAFVPAKAQPPLCPHVLAFTTPVRTWATGAPWIKVIFASDIPTAQSCGAQVFYRPYDTSVGTDDGDLPIGLTGTAYADAVWAKISGLAVKPAAVGYRNEFPWTGTTENRHTSSQFRSYRDRLRALGYTGLVVYGSWGVGWPDSAVWDEPEVMDAASCADAIETHEYFDLDVNCISPWLTFRHRDIAINGHPALLGSKPWFIGEFGSDNVCGPWECADPQCRQGWLDRGKLTDSAYVTQMGVYRANCHPNVVAIFVFQQGAPGWANFETINSTVVSDYMKSTWSVSTGAIVGTVRTPTGAPISGAAVSTNIGGYTATTDTAGNYTLANVTGGPYTVTASRSGYASASASVNVTAGNTITQDFTLVVQDVTPPAITNIVPSTTWIYPNGPISVTANVTDDIGVTIGNVNLIKSNNLLTNPSFESGLAGWTNGSTPAFVSDNTYPAPGAKDGAHWAGASCGYGSGVKWPEIRQVVSVTAQTKYFLSVWVNTDGSPNPCSAFLQWKNGAATGDAQCTTIAMVNSNTSGWKRLYGVVTPTGSQLTIGLKLSWDCAGTGGGGNFDMAEVRPAPIPNTFVGGVATWNNVAVPQSYAFQVYARDSTGNADIATSAITVNVDPTAPTTPSVSDDGMYTVDTASLHAVWTASDPESGVAEYQYAIGTTSGGTDVAGWASTGTQAFVTRTGLSLAYDAKYYLCVKAKNVAGQFGAVGSSDGITIARPVGSIPIAKGYTDGSAVRLTDKILTAKIGSASWVQEPDRSSGIKVSGTTSADLGSRMTVTGKLLTVDGERKLDEPDVVRTGDPEPFDPVYMPNRSLGGGSFGAHVPGITGGAGTNNIGLLVTTFGAIKFAGDGFFYVDDGSALNDGSGHLGLKVLAAGLSFPSTGWALVTGISSCERNASGDIVPLLRVRTQADIVPL